MVVVILIVDALDVNVNVTGQIVLDEIEEMNNLMQITIIKKTIVFKTVVKW
jgi:hypothetical protein